MTTAVIVKTPATLSVLVRAESATYEEVAAHVDALDPEARVREIREMPGRFQARLWTLCEAAPPFAPDDVVAPSLGEGQMVAWAGKNSLPMFTWFEKRFARLDGKVIGYNHQTMSWITGPGYFTVEPAASRPKEVNFNYTAVPAKSPEGWPALKPNSAGLSRFVYHNLHDFCRRIGSHALIGEATRLGKPMNSYFVIARR